MATPKQLKKLPQRLKQSLSAKNRRPLTKLRLVRNINNQMGASASVFAWGFYERTSIGIYEITGSSFA
ncbi:hypothetical protein [Escherichia phage IMM-001]|nr:hypothetical protein [Escherichia phage IMM-001]